MNQFSSLPTANAEYRTVVDPELFTWKREGRKPKWEGE